MMNKNFQSTSDNNNTGISSMVDHENFNRKVLNKEGKGDKKLMVYTWIYRWDMPVEFEIRMLRDKGLLPARRTLTGVENEEK